MINIIGTILGTSGYDVHTRNLARAIGKQTDARLTIQAGPGWETQVDDKELEMIKNKSVDDEINLIITNPMLWRMNTNANRNWAFLVWEGNCIPKCYLEECLNPEIEYIFVPSQHTKQAILNTIYPIILIGDDELDSTIEDKIKVMPHGVDLSLFYPKNEKSYKLEGDSCKTTDCKPRCVFLANKGFRNLEDRGGIQYLIRAYFEEFTDKDMVELILKINPAYGIPNLQESINKLAPRKEGLPLINIDIQNYPYNKLVDLYNRGTIFVSPTRSEAYNLPCIEAMACGLPVITTTFGGQTDYCSKETGWMIDGQLEEVKHEILYEGVKWLTPDIKQLREALRQAYENPDLVKRYGLTALSTARLNTWDNTAKKICVLI